MAIDDDGGERTRFPFLATVRYVVAAAVSTLTIIIVAKVIKVALRPVNIRLSILQGFVEADTLWQEVTSTTGGSNTSYGGAASESKLGVVMGSSPHSLEPGFGLGGDDGVTYTSYVAAKYVNLVVSLRAQNPSGRAHMECYNITMRILDLPAASSDNAYFYNNNNNNSLVDLGTYHVSEDQFSVEQESSYTVRNLVTVKDTGALSHIAATYGGKSSFYAMLQVNAAISYTTAVTTMSSKVVSHYCWPVTVGSYVPSSAPDEVTCKPSEEMGYIPQAKPATN